MANSCGRAARGDDVGKERFAVLCEMLLMVFQRARGLQLGGFVMKGLELRSSMNLG